MSVTLEETEKVRKESNKSIEESDKAGIFRKEIYSEEDIDKENEVTVRKREDFSKVFIDSEGKFDLEKIRKCIQKSKTDRVGKGCSSRVFSNEFRLPEFVSTDQSLVNVALFGKYVMKIIYCDVGENLEKMMEREEIALKLKPNRYIVPSYFTASGVTFEKHDVLKNGFPEKYFEDADAFIGGVSFMSHKGKTLEDYIKKRKGQKSEKKEEEEKDTQSESDSDIILSTDSDTENDEEEKQKDSRKKEDKPRYKSVDEIPLGPFDCLESLYIAKGILKGVIYLKNNSIVHRDLHFGNVFVKETDGRVWIGDFGVSIEIKGDTWKLPKSDASSLLSCSGCSTGCYSDLSAREHLPPEVRIENKDVEFVDYEKCDDFSVGILFYNMATLDLKSPISLCDQNDSKEEKWRKLELEIEENKRKYKGHVLSNVIDGLLELRPEHRLTVDKALEEVEERIRFEEWQTGFSSTKVEEKEQKTNVKTEIEEEEEEDEGEEDEEKFKQKKIVSKEWIAFAAQDQDYTGTSPDDIFLVHPETGKTMNITNGKVNEEGWSQPWEPVGAKNRVVFRQWNPSKNGITRVFLAEYEFLEAGKSEHLYCWKLREAEEIFQSAILFAWSNDGESIAFVEKKSSGPVISIMNSKDLLVTKRIPIFGTSPSRTNWSKDGKWIAVVTSQGVWVADPEGVKMFLISTDPNSGYAFGNKINSMAVVRNKTIYIVDLESKASQLLRMRDENRQEVASILDWSDDGKYISFTGEPVSSRKYKSIFILNVKSGSTVLVNPPLGDNYSGVFSEDSKLMAFWNINPRGVCSLGAVKTSSGSDYKILDSCSRAGFMSPSWVNLSLSSFD